MNHRDTLYSVWVADRETSNSTIRICMGGEVYDFDEAKERAQDLAGVHTNATYFVVPIGCVFGKDNTELASEEFAAAGKDLVALVQHLDEGT